MRDIFSRATSGALVLEAGHGGGDGLLTVGGSAREHDRTPLGCVVTQTQRICVNRALCAAAGINDYSGPVHKADDSEASRPSIISADPDLDIRPVELQHWTQPVEPIGAPFPPFAEHHSLVCRLMTARHAGVKTGFGSETSREVLNWWERSGGGKQADEAITSAAGQ
jgi:hypothetical protein